MNDTINLLLGLFKEWKVSTRWLAISIVLILGTVALYQYEKSSHHFFYTKIEKKISLLKNLNELSKENIKSNPELSPLYIQITKELEETSNSNDVLPYALPLSKEDFLFYIGRFISGVALWLVILIFGVKTEINKNTQNNRSKYFGIMPVVIVIILLSAISVWVSYKIPVIYSEWFNIILFPIVSFVSILILMRIFSKK